MKIRIAALTLMVMFVMLPFEGQASTGGDKTSSDAAEYNVQEFRLPGAPSGGYRGDYRFRVKGKSKHGSHRKAHKGRARHKHRGR